MLEIMIRNCILSCGVNYIRRFICLRQHPRKSVHTKIPALRPTVHPHQDSGYQHLFRERTFRTGQTGTIKSGNHGRGAKVNLCQQELTPGFTIPKLPKSIFIVVETNPLLPEALHAGRRRGGSVG